MNRRAMVAELRGERDRLKKKMAELASEIDAIDKAVVALSGSGKPKRARRAPRGQAECQILDHLRKYPARRFAPAELAQELDLPPATAYGSSSRLARRRQVQVDGHTVYHKPVTVVPGKEIA